MSPAHRHRFDALLEEVLDSLAPRLRDLLEEVPLIVDDRPEPDLARSLYTELGHEPGESLEDFTSTLCGLHTGIALTERSVSNSGDLPDHIRIFREGIVNIAGGWQPQEGETRQHVDEAVYEEIAITVLHEIGHHFGLDEKDLEELGYA
jgi:predicted Zn-dependent protease with MMP-like domain